MMKRENKTARKEPFINSSEIWLSTPLEDLIRNSDLPTNLSLGLLSAWNPNSLNAVSIEASTSKNILS